MTEPADPALAARIREQVGRTQPGMAPVPRLAMAIAAVVAVAVVAGLLVARYGMPWSTSGLPATQATASPAPLPSGAPPTAASATPATPTPAGPGQVVPSGAPPAQGFSCTNQSGGTASPVPPLLGVTAVRTGQQSGYDRFVIEFNGPVPPFEVRRQTTATFVQDGSGKPVTLQGAAGVLVLVRNVSAHETYSGPTNLAPGYAVLREAQQVGDFEGVVQWGLGLSRPACIRTSVLTDPSRLVVDLQT